MKLIYFIIKMNAVIKLSNTQYLKVLEELLLMKIQINDQKISIVKLSFFNFINLLISIFTQYIKQTTEEPLNLFILNFIQSHSSSAFEFYRQAQGLITMWKKGQSILSSLATSKVNQRRGQAFPQNQKSDIEKYRSKDNARNPTKPLGYNNINTYDLYSRNENLHKQKDTLAIFQSQKKTLYSNNKINGAVVCEFLMTCSEKFQKQQLDNVKMYFQNNPQETQEYLKRRIFKPLQENNYQNKSIEQIDHGLSYPLQQQPINKQSPKFRYPLQKQPKQNNFIANNLYKPKLSDAISPDKKVLSSKYSQSWQKFLQTNKQMKEKLLNSAKNDY